MPEQRFTMGEAWDFGWAKVRENAGFFITVALLVILCGWMPRWVADNFLEPYPLISLIFRLAGGVLGFWLQFGLINITLKYCDQQSAGFENLVDATVEKVWNFFLVSLLSGLAVVAGFILLIIPGIIIGIRLQFACYLVIDKNMGFIDALNRSFTLTRGSSWDLFFFNAAMALINLAGFLCLGVGLLVTIPATMLAMAFVYRRFEATDLPGVNLTAT